MGWELLWYGLTALGLVDALRCRKLSQSIPVAKAQGGDSTEYGWLAGPGVVLDPAARHAAEAFAGAKGLDVLALIPQQLPATTALGLVQALERDQVRQDRLARVRMVGSGLLAKREILERARLAEGSVASVEALSEAASKLRRYAPGGFDFAIAPGLSAGTKTPFSDWKAYHGLFGPAAGPMIFFSLLAVAILWLGVALYPVAGAAALLVFHLQPTLALAGGPLEPRRLLSATLLRSPKVVWDGLRLGFGSLDSSARKAEIEALRPTYERLYREGRDRFFHPPFEQCPVCSAANLVQHLETGDLFQNKPGCFCLDRCRDCGHIFQNPQLAPVGLDYYYRDFYDGLGRAEAEAFFSYGVKNQRDQVATVLSVCRPQRWLDVGGGHGQLCQVAAGQSPETRFEALDLSEAIEEAERCGWVEKAHRGFFPALAPSMKNRFDLVSMFHYLEHTVDQRAELRAAYTAVAPGGHVIIEVPNPESAFSGWLGKYWLPWFQPQHLHLIHRANLERLLREVGFEPVLSLTVKGSQRTSLLFGAVMLIHRLAPAPLAPWRPPAGLWGRTRYLLVQWASPFLLAAAAIADRLVAAFGDSPRLASAYRVMARTTKQP
ncbi:MAG: methyltransferase domain-containing protein [Acidobacteria bacterium]|nr:methyltransferase domain-containing protein [Acidobacteriota bacterium]